MAFEVFNFGKQLGIVGGTDFEPESLSPLTLSKQSGVHQPKEPIKISLSDLSSSIGSDSLPPIVGKTKTEVNNHFADCPLGAFQTLVRQERWRNVGGSDVEPNDVIENYFGCEFPYGGSGTGGGVQGPLQRGTYEGGPYIKRKDPVYNVRFKPCAFGAGGSEGVCCKDEQKEKIRTLINDILNDTYITFTFGGLRQCMIDALKSLEFICVEDGVIDYPPTDVYLNSWAWSYNILQTGKVWLPESAIQPRFLIRAMLAKCPGWGPPSTTHNRSAVLEGFIMNREIPPCEVLNNHLSTRYGNDSVVRTKFLEWDLITGKIYLINADNSRGMQVNRGSEGVWKCKKGRSGTYECCP